MGRVTHGDSRSVEFNVWRQMKRRCADPLHKSYARYGGRGIRVCQSWNESYATFLADVGRRPSPKHSLDRIDNDGNYEPGNCRWATVAEQSRNRVTNVFVTMPDGRRLTVGDAASELGITGEALSQRVRRLGWTWEQAVACHGKRSATLRPACKRGHPMHGENIYVRKDGGGRMCLACMRMNTAAKNARVSLERAARSTARRT